MNVTITVDVEELDERSALLRSFYGPMSGRFDRRLLRAEVDGETVGSALIGPPRVDFGPWVGELYQLQVHPDHRGRGIGTRLHSRCLDAWRAAGTTVGVLELRADDDGMRAFYESNGWRPDGHTRTGHRNTSYVRLRRAIN